MLHFRLTSPLEALTWTYDAFDPRSKRTICQLSLNRATGKYIIQGHTSLGRFDDPRDAVEAYRARDGANQAAQGHGDGAG